jgi:chromosome segregation ATPase
MTENSLDAIIANIYQEFGDDKDNSNCKVMMREHFVDKLQVYEIPEAILSALRVMLQKEGYDEGSFLPQIHVTSILNDMIMRNIDTVSQTGSDLDNIENYSEMCSQSYSAYGGDSPAKVLKESNSSNSLVVSYAQKENERLKKQLKENEKEHEKTNEQCIKYESENEYLKREIESLKKQKKMLSHQNDNLKADQADFIDVRNELDEAKQTIKDMEFEIKKIITEKDQAWETVKCVRSEKDGIRMELDQEMDNSAMKDEGEHSFIKTYQGLI